MLDGPWNHTAHYHHLLLDAVPDSCERALELGCGEGDFARKLAARARRVDAVDRAADVLRRARAASTSVPNLHFIEADIMSLEVDLRFDFVCSLATLHHLPLAPALDKMKTLLRPGGVLALIGLYRSESVADLARAVVATPVSWYFKVMRGHELVRAPVQTPRESLREIETHVARCLPSAQLKRHLLWRYSVTWTKPR